MNSTTRSLLNTLLLCVALVLFVTWLNRAFRDGSDRPAGLVSQTPAPEIHAEQWFNTAAVGAADVSGPGGVPSLAAIKAAGQIAVVEFWATWCPPCRESIPHLVKLHHRLADRGVVVIGLTDEPADRVRPFLETMKVPYIIGTGSHSSEDYTVAGIPTAFVIDTAGRIVWSGHPLDGAMESTIEQQLEARAKAQLSTNP